MRSLVTHIQVGPEEILLTINGAHLSPLAKKGLGVDLGGQVPIEKHLTIPYVIKRGRNGCLIINPESEEKGFLDMPKDELKRLVQGVVWRDRHFAGETFTAIAKDENYSETYVRRSITKSFETLKKHFN